MHCPALYLFVRKGRDGGYTAGGPSGEESDLRGTPTLGRGEGHGGRGKDIVGVSNTSAIFILSWFVSPPPGSIISVGSMSGKIPWAHH